MERRKEWNGRQNNYYWPNGKMVGFTFPRGLRQAPEVVKLSNCADEVGTQMIHHDNPWNTMKQIWILIHIDTWYTNGKETQSDDVWLQGLRWKTATLWPLFLKICGVYDPQGPEVMRPIDFVLSQKLNLRQAVLLETACQIWQMMWKIYEL